VMLTSHSSLTIEFSLLHPLARSISQSASEGQESQQGVSKNER